MVKGKLKNGQKKSISAAEFLQLHRWNSWLAVIYAIQGVAIFIFGAAYSVPVIVNYLAINPINSAVVGHSVLSSATRPLFNVSVTGLIVIFLLITAVAHGLLATLYRKRYESELVRGINMIRWLEYAGSAGLMLVVVGIVSGIYDLATLIAIFDFMVVMCLFGFIIELKGENGSSGWLSYWGGAIAGFVPWLIIGLYAFNDAYYGSAHVSTYVYWIYGTVLLCTAGFALNVYLRYKKQGKWSSYLYTERIFMVLNLAVKTFLAWQVFAGVLRP